jgi:hypothetical protein
MIGIKWIYDTNRLRSDMYYYNQINSKKSFTRSSVLFEDIITGNVYKVMFEYTKGKEYSLPHIFSRSQILQEWT